MALLRCPRCHARGEVIDDDPLRRVRCSVCGHVFVAGEADPTHEYNILSDDSPLFLTETPPDSKVWSIPPPWNTWIEHLAAHCGLEPAEALRQALAQFARSRKFAERPPRE